jgi:putative DNA methylase
MTAKYNVTSAVVSTDPPYYGNIDYAELSDFFYIWLRRSLSKIYPDIFNTLLVPKAQALVATPFRFDGDREKARDFFEDGLRKTFNQVHDIQNSAFPLTVYYAFKQSETDEDDEENSEVAIASTGWETMLEGLLQAKFTITGTWPMRTESSGRAVARNANALASSIVLVCRPRPVDAPTATRREFIASLKRELPPALKELQRGYIAPVDLAQATIGPGMAVFSRFSEVLDADGSPMRVRAALALINQTLDEFLTEQEGEFDSDTRWALAWFEQFGHNEGAFGDAETLSKAKNTSVNGLVHAGILEARAGKVRLLKRDELDADWTPEKDDRRAVWEATQYLIRALDEGGEQAAADLLRRLGSLGETARDLAYRLYSICERKGWASGALAYNMLAAAWPRLTELATRSTPRQDALL